MLLHTHTLPGHLGTAGAPHSRGRPPPTPNILSVSHIHTHTHLMGWAPSWGRGLGPTVGAGDLSWESALKATPSLGFLAQCGGQESPILLQGWQGKRTAAGEAGRTDGGVDRAACARQVNK